MADGSDDQIAALVLWPAEGIAVELKTWIDPRTPEGVDKIVRGTFALRNHNGGFMVIGFNYGTAAPDPYSLSGPIEDVFHVDVIQGIVSRYASQPFAVEVNFRERNGQLHPVISVPPGVRVPVIVKSDLTVAGRRGLSRSDLFFRTLRSNNTVSSSPITPDDYPELMEICFNNREADIGGFLRRQLGQSDVAALSMAIRGLLGLGVAVLEQPDLKAQTIALMKESADIFAQAIADCGDQALAELCTSRLTMEVGLILKPERPDETPTRGFLDLLARANPQYTGWPIWLDSRHMSNDRSRPVVINGAWQALIVSVENVWSKHVDFMRLDPRGKFYLRRLMQDDLVDQVPVGSSLDVGLMLYRVAEVLAVGVSFARAAGWSDDSTASFGFCWTALNGRRLNAWANPATWIDVAGGRSATSYVESFVSLSVGTPHTALAPHVSQAVKPLFATR